MSLIARQALCLCNASACKNALCAWYWLRCSSNEPSQWTPDHGTRTRTTGISEQPDLSPHFCLRRNSSAAETAHVTMSFCWWKRQIKHRFETRVKQMFMNHANCFVWTACNLLNSYSGFRRQHDRVGELFSYRGISSEGTCWSSIWQSVGFNQKGVRSAEDTWWFTPLESHAQVFLLGVMGAMNY